MDQLSADLATYYDDEAIERHVRSIDPERVRRRDEFVTLVTTDGLRSLVDVGMGPGRDTVAFRAAGLAAVGIDLAFENVRLARADGIDAVRASLFRLPVRDASFDVVWTMSTLVHVPDSRFDEAMSELCRAVTPGGLLAVGLWGGRDREEVLHLDPSRPGRFFSLRTHRRAETMLGVHGDVERFDSWSIDGHEWDYQFAVLRKRGNGSSG